MISAELRDAISRPGARSVSGRPGELSSNPNQPEMALRSKLSMPTESNPPTEVLHSENHSKLTAEEVAKAVARHNKNHSAAKAENEVLKANKKAKK
jgi:hypothetical protein